MQNKMMYLIRGLPGSGKTTVATQLATMLGTEYFEADQYFYKNGEYNFDASKLKYAHEECYDLTEHAMFHAYPVIVSNTFTTEKELKPYLDLAKKYNYIVVSLVVENRHGNVSVHNVPAETMANMKNRFTVKL